MYLRDQRANRVDDTQPASAAVLADLRRDSVSGEDADLAGRNLVLRVDEDGAEPLQPTNDVVVVDDLVPDVDRRTVVGEQPLDDLDRAVDARTEGPRSREEHAPTHVTPPNAFSAPRAPAAARAVPSGARTNPARSPR